ncbi:hypothetical protein R5R35_007269 [Gryllus longicercus]|uniref:Uncharacterized protein n=1 Tax=Gryllus longicercus TaxID=2509291 RepID=A0AAN9VWB0_9ORTH
MAFANARARRCWPLAAGFDSPRAGLLDAASLALCVGAGGRVSLGALRWELTDRRVDAAAARRSTERNGADYPDAGSWACSSSRRSGPRPATPPARGEQLCVRSQEIP